MPAKRTELLIQTFRELQPEERLHLVIVGQAPGDHADYYQSLLDAASGQRNIHFTGWLSPLQIYEHLLMADLAVFPASQSILWQQAIAAGLPLVIGDIAGGDQDVSYLSPYENVLVTDQSRPMRETLRESLSNLIDNTARREAMATGAVKAAAELLDWDTLAEKTLRFHRR
jgi:glycosyltransferase involved in cell wall biosynthesis